jgi:hypothetical protein
MSVLSRLLRPSALQCRAPGGWEGVERTDAVLGALSAGSEGWNLCLVGISTAKAPPVELRHYAADRLGMHRTAVARWVADLGTDSTRLGGVRFDVCGCRGRACARDYSLERVHITHDCTTTATAAGSALIAPRRSPLVVGTKQGKQGKPGKQAKDEAGRASEHEHAAGRLEHSGQMTD